MSDKDIVWLHGEIKQPPFSLQARLKAGYLLRLLQQGKFLEPEDSTSMPIIGKRCYELRIQSDDKWWRIIHRIDDDAIVIVDVFQKKSNKTPKQVIERCKKRLKRYDDLT